MVKDYLHNPFKHAVEAGKMQLGVALETASADVADNTVSSYKTALNVHL